jgi:hypothetical protein
VGKSRKKIYRANSAAAQWRTRSRIWARSSRRRCPRTTQRSAQVGLVREIVDCGTAVQAIRQFVCAVWWMSPWLRFGTTNGVAARERIVNGLMSLNKFAAVTSFVRAVPRHVQLCYRRRSGWSSFRLHTGISHRARGGSDAPCNPPPSRLPAHSTPPPSPARSLVSAVQPARRCAIWRARPGLWWGCCSWRVPRRTPTPPASRRRRTSRTWYGATGM